MTLTHDGRTVTVVNPSPDPKPITHPVDDVLERLICDIVDGRGVIIRLYREEILRCLKTKL